jgi:hypothetical protein
VHKRDENELIFSLTVPTEREYYLFILRARSSSDQVPDGIQLNLTFPLHRSA